MWFTLIGLLFVARLIGAVHGDDGPSLEIQPKSGVITKAVGSSLALTCKPNVQDSTQISQLEWRDPKNRKIESNPDALPYVQQLTSEPGAVLIFSRLEENHAGQYTCTAKYANTEEIEAHIKLETIIDITWIDAPESQYPIEGKDHRIRCEVQANPPPIVDWVKNGNAIVSNDRYVIDNKGLLIKNVTQADDGIYTCRALVLKTGNIKERNIKVEVNIPPKIKKMQEMSIIEGEQAAIKCEGSGKPPPEYTWIKVNTREDLSKADRFSVQRNTGLLLVTKAEYNDNSMYKCIAENQAGRTETEVKINVLVKPRIFEYLNVTTPINTQTKIICKAFGRPTPTVVFRKLSIHDAFTLGVQRRDQRIITEQPKDEQKGETSGMLIISNVNRTDDGLYECIAENKVGTAYKNGHITVEFPPTFEKTKDYPPVWTWDNKPANLSCIAESIPNATIKWRLNGVEISNNVNFEIVGHGPSSNLIVKAYNDKRLFTEYECFAMNRLGEAIKIIQLRQATVPGLVQQVTRADLTATTVKFNIVGPPNLHGLPLRAFIVQYRSERERTWDTSFNRTWSIDAPYIIENLIPQETYDFRFAAKNDVGIGGYGGNQQITMPRRSVPAEPRILVSNYNENSTRDFVAVSPYADHFELRWNVPSDNGDPIDSYLIRYCMTQRINGEWRDSDTHCSSEIIQSFQYTHYELENLRADTTYKIELRAHNAIGSSLPAQIRVKTARGIDTMISSHEDVSISSAMIIGIVVGVVVAVLVLVDLICFCANRAGILAMLCSRSKSVDEDPKLGSEEKEPLSPENRTQPINGDKRNISVEFDGSRVYTKPAEIGRHSAV